MKPIRKILDSIKPHVEKGGKFHAFQSLFEAAETFFFVSDEVTKKGSHIRDGVDMKRTMFTVVVALMPALLFAMWNVGNLHFKAIGQEAVLMEAFWYGLLKVLPLIIVSYAVGLGIEIAFAQKRGHEVNEGFFVSGMLIPLIVPVTTPLWMLAVAVAFAVVFGKEVFGGTGMNIVNPALLTRVFLFFNFPSAMSGEKVWIIGHTDAISSATPLAELTAGHGSGISILQMFVGDYAGSLGETSMIAILLGAAYLLYTGVASWKIMFSFFVGGLSMGLILNGISASFPANAYFALPAWQHLLIGGFAFGGVFMITDPVTATQTETGKWIYGFAGGFLAILVRTLNPAFPEGVMLAILFLNIFAPTIDFYVVESNIKKRLKRSKVKA